MPSTTIQPMQSATFTVPSGSKVATYSGAQYTIDENRTFANAPSVRVNVFRNSGSNTTSAYGKATEVVISAGAQAVLYAVGTNPTIVERSGISATANTLNATGTLTVAMMLNGIVTSTTAAAVTATLDTGATVDAAHPIDVGDGFMWSVINTGSNTYTVTASSGHTVVGAGAVAAGTSGRFMTVKTGANTFVSYRIS